MPFCLWWDSLFSIHICKHYKSLIYLFFIYYACMIMYHRNIVVLFFSLAISIYFDYWNPCIGFYFVHSAQHECIFALFVIECKWLSLKRFILGFPPDVVLFVLVSQIILSYSRTSILWVFLCVFFLLLASLTCVRLLTCIEICCWVNMQFLSKYHFLL